MSDTKQKIRADLLRKRRNLSSSEHETASDIITQSILTLDLFQKAQNIALYHAFSGEVSLERLGMIANQLGKKTAFPVISSDRNTKTMDFFESSLNDIKNNPENSPAQRINHFNIREPDPDTSIKMDINKVDCIFIPLVAFDQKGYRLGMGQGYYDRALEKLSLIKKVTKNQALSKKTYLIGVGYDFQLINKLPHDSWDIPLDAVVTEKQVYIYNRVT